MRQIPDLMTDRRGHGPGERHVLVDGVDPEHPGLAVVRGIQLAHSGTTGAGDAQGAQAPLVADAERRADRDYRVVRVDPGDRLRLE